MLRALLSMDDRASSRNARTTSSVPLTPSGGRAVYGKEAHDQAGTEPHLVLKHFRSYLILCLCFLVMALMPGG